MNFKRNDILFTKRGKRAYTLVGRSGRDYVLAPIDDKDDECLIYSENEILEIFNTKQERIEKGPNALFGRKVSDLSKLKILTELALSDGQSAKPVLVNKEVDLENEAFQLFSSNFLQNQPWIEQVDTCIRVKNIETGETVLVDPQGYEYPRYVSLEIE